MSGVSKIYAPLYDGSVAQIYPTASLGLYYETGSRVGDGEQSYTIFLQHKPILFILIESAPNASQDNFLNGFIWISNSAYGRTFDAASRIGNSYVYCTWNNNDMNLGITGGSYVAIGNRANKNYNYLNIYST